MSIRGSSLLLICALGVTAFGCEDKKAAPKPEGSDGGARHAMSHDDKNIVAAVQAVGSAAAEQGPPDTGVFAPGAADKELSPGAPPKLSFGIPGTGTLVQLTPPPAKPAKKLEGKVEVSIQTGPRSALPTVELGLSTETEDKSSEPAGKNGTTSLLVKATSVKLAADQPVQLPDGLEAEIGKARGSRFTLAVLPNGAGRVTGIEPAKDLDESLAIIIRAASDAFVFAFQPYPTKPVGHAGFWMVTSRESYAGLDAVVYRMYKVVEAKPDRVTLDVNVKRFVSPGQLSLAGVPPHSVEQFSDNVTGRMSVSPTDTSVVDAQLTDTLVVLANPAGAAAQAQAQGQRMKIQLQFQTHLTTSR